MAILVGVMVAGFLAGWRLRGRPRLIARLTGLTRPVIFALLFLMGVSLGLDEHTMGNLGAIGLSSLGFAVLTIAGSMLVLALVLPLVRYRRPDPATPAPPAPATTGAYTGAPLDVGER